MIVWLLPSGGSVPIGSVQIWVASQMELYKIAAGYIADNKTTEKLKL